MIQVLVAWCRSVGLGHRTGPFARSLVLVLTLGACGYNPPRQECIAPADPGGGWDLTCRTVSHALSELGLSESPLRVRNIPGNGGGVAFSHVIQEEGSNNELIVAASPSTLLGLVQGKYGNYTENDVRWVAAVGVETGVIAVNSNSPWRTLQEFADDWRRDPGGISVGGESAPGGQDHMKALMFARQLGLRARDVHYVSFSSGEAVTALRRDSVQMYPGDASELLSDLEAGNVRILAVLAADRERGMLANTPTARELGYDVEWVVWRGFYAPPLMSDSAHARWMARLVAMTDSEEWPQLLAARGITPYLSTGAAFEATVHQQAAELRELSREIGLIR